MSINVLFITVDEGEAESTVVALDADAYDLLEHIDFRVESDSNDLDFWMGMTMDASKCVAMPCRVAAVATILIY